MSNFQRPHCQNRDACTAAKPTTHCRRCSILRVQSDPTMEARRIEKLREKYEDPDFLDEHRARLRKAIEVARKQPGYFDRKRENGQRLHRDFLSRPDVVARNRSPEVRKAAGLKTSEKRLAWCPREYRAEYRHMIVTKHVLAVDARRIIMAKVERARLAGLNPDIAADHLRRITSVFRCDADGRIDPVGTHWRYGTRILERFDVIKLAIDKGCPIERLAA